MGDKGRIAPVGDQPRQRINDADPPVGQRQQRCPTVDGDAPAIEGSTDFLTRHAWQIEQKARLVIHGGRGALEVWNCVGLRNQNLFQLSCLRYVHQPNFRLLLSLPPRIAGRLYFPLQREDACFSQGRPRARPPLGFSGR